MWWTDIDNEIGHLSTKHSKVLPCNQIPYLTLAKKSGHLDLWTSNLWTATPVHAPLPTLSSTRVARRKICALQIISYFQIQINELKQNTLEDEPCIRHLQHYSTKSIFSNIAHPADGGLCHSVCSPPFLVTSVCFQYTQHGGEAMVVDCSTPAYSRLAQLWMAHTLRSWV